MYLIMALSTHLQVHQQLKSLILFIALHWVLEYCGIPGKTKVGKEATSQMSVTQRVMASAFVEVIKHVLNGQWEEEWVTILFNKLREVNIVRPGVYLYAPVV